MRVLHFLSKSSLGGAQVVVFALMKALRELNETMTQGVALPGGGPYAERFRTEGFETFEMPLNSLFVTSGRIRRLVEGFGADIIHTHEWWAGLHVRHAIQHSPAYRTFHSYHGFHASESALIRKVSLGLENTLMAKTDGLICLSESEANEVHRLVPGARGKIQVIQNCVDAEQVVKDGREALPQTLATWFDRNSTKRVISMIARPTRVKNHDLAFAAAEIVLKQNSGYAFLFVGLPPGDGRYRKLKKRFGHSVLAVPYLSNIAPVIRRTWSLFLPSVREACPLVILEGFALGIPTIGTKAPGIVDVLQDQWNGFLMDPVPTALGSILSLVDQNRELYANARQGAREQGGYLRMRSWARQYIDAYTLKPAVPTPAA